MTPVRPRRNPASSRPASPARPAPDPDASRGAARGVADAVYEEADPLEASRALLRRGAALARRGRLAEASAAVRLSGELARAARALGIAEADDGWDDDEEEAEPEPELTEAEIAELRADVTRRFARFDRPAAPAAPGPAEAVACKSRAGDPGAPDPVAPGPEAEPPRAAPATAEAARAPRHPPWPAWAEPLRSDRPLGIW